MKTLIMQIPMKPLSVNSKFTVNRGYMVKTNSVKKFEKEVFCSLLPYRKDADEFLKYKIESLETEIVIYIPDGEFFTKKGTVSLTCLDCSNAIKIVEDQVFNFLGLNDGLNVSISSEKRPWKGDEYMTLVTIKSVDKPIPCALDRVTFSSSF